MRTFAPKPKITGTSASSSASRLLGPSRGAFDNRTALLIQTERTLNEPGDRYEQEADRVAEEVVRSGPTPSPLPLSRVGYDFSKIRVSTPPAPIQAKLTVNEPGDKYEQEADRIAEEVMRTPDFFPGGISAGGPPNVQKKCAACESNGGLCSDCAEEKERLQRKPLSWTLPPLVQREQAQPGLSHDSHGTADLTSRVQALTSTGGMPLHETERAFFEPRFGFDFSQVRVHNDAGAAELAYDLNARAFTIGNNIAFGAGQYAPETNDGRRLLAHELTHVVQQADGSISMLQRDMVGQRACPLREELPSGDLSNRVRFDLLGGGRVYLEQFNMNIDWNGTGSTCVCRCGEYRQFVQGHAKVNGRPISKKLFGNAYLEDGVWHEDADDQGQPYGHRDIPGAPDDRFINPDNRQTGCSYRGNDSPWLEARPGDFVEWHLQFKGQTYDRCKAEQDIFPYGPIHRWWIRFNQQFPGISPPSQEFPSTVATRYHALKTSASRLQRYPVLSFPEDFPPERRLVQYFIAPQERPFLTFVHFHNTGNTSNPDCVGSTSLGKFPYGLLYNAMEIRFDVPDALLQYYRNFQFRRFIQETLWQQVNGHWSQVSATPTAQPDHPILEPACTQPPHLYDYDSPGWYQLRSTRVLQGYEGQRTHQLATQIVLRQNFSEWVEGEAAEGAWRRASQIVPWHNIVGLRRSRPTADWYSTHLTEIELGQTSLEQTTVEVGEQSITPLIQRQSKLPEENGELRQTKDTAGNMPQITTNVAADINAVRGGGQPLPPSVRAFFEPRFGYDFSGVRVHADTKASESAQAVNARAYTMGKDVVFGAGQFAPQTEAGKQLLAHELSHIVQQGASVPIPSTLSQAVTSNDPAEAEAQHAAEAIWRNQSFNLTPQRIGGIFRDELDTSTLSTQNFQQLWNEFDEHRSNLRAAQALAMVPSLLGRMLGDDALNCAGELAIWLIQNNEWTLAQEALRNLETAWWIRFVVENGPGVPITYLRTFGPVGPERLMEQAEQQAAVGQHDRARELFGLAFLFLQMQLISHSDRRFVALGRLSQFDERVASGFTQFRLWSYADESQIIAKMRQIISFYAVKERQALVATQTAQAQQFATEGHALRQYLRDHSLLSGSGEGVRAITLEATFGTVPGRGPGYRLHGVQGHDAFVTPLPGEPRPDELGRHPAYSASMEELLETVGGQEDFITEILQHSQIRSVFGLRLISMNDVNARLIVWRTMYTIYQSQPASGCSTALCSLLRLMERYLRHFTVHTGYNIRDFGVSYLDSQFPEDLLGRTVRDCGVYALTVANEVYRTARDASPRLPVGFQLYHTLEHAMLVIFDQSENNHYVVSNNQIDGPRTGDAAASVATAYAGLMGRNQLLSVGGRTNVLTTSMSNASFRTSIWQSYKSGALLGLEAEPSSGPGDTRTDEQRREDTHRHYYAAMERFDRLAGVAHVRLDALGRGLSDLARAEHNSLVSAELPTLTQLAIELVRIFQAYAFNPQAVGLRPGATVPVESLVFVTTGRTTGSHPLARLGTALMYAESLGITLNADQQTLLSWIRNYPSPSFPNALSDYDAAGRPATF